MLKGTKSTSLSYNSVVGGKNAIYMSASIPESGKSNVNTTIQDLELYEANKKECRADMTAFNQLVFDLEDQGTEGAAE